MPRPRIDAIAVSAVDLTRSVGFYRLLGFELPPLGKEDKHIEAVTEPGQPRLMLDDAELLASLTGQTPAPATQSSFALLCDSPAEVDRFASAVRDSGGTIVREPWDAFWGQRYAIVADPDGYKVDLFAPL